MKKFIYIIIGLVVVSVVAFFIFAPEDNSSTTTKQNPVAEAVSLASSSQAIIFDVRTPEEFNTSHANNSINYDLNILLTGKMPDVSKDSKIYVYCRSGNRSSQAKSILNQNGFSNVTDLGGLDNMRSGGAI